VLSAKGEREVHCPECGGRRLEKKPSVFAAHGATESTTLPVGGCGRCGDPSGPCGMG
jgi:hypothetical protein